MEVRLVGWGDGWQGWVDVAPRAVKPTAAGRSRASALRGPEAGGRLAQLLKELRTSSPCENSFLTPFFSVRAYRIITPECGGWTPPGKVGA